MAKLTNRQRVFVELYLTLWNATEAARQAGYSAKTAQEQSSRLLSNVIVKSEIERQIKDLTATREEVFERLTAHSRGNMADFLDGYGLIDIDKARTARKLSLVKKIKQHTTRISKKDGEDVEYHDIELELYDAQAATVQLGKLLGMYASEAPQVTVNNNLAMIGIRPIDYRTGLAALAPGSVSDTDASGNDETGSGGETLG